MKKYTTGTGHSELGAEATKRNSAHMLPVCDWLSDLAENTQLTDLIEVQFKNTRKGYFHNSNHLPLEKGVKVVVEANPGYDVGEVVLTGKLVELQIKKNKIDSSRYEIRQHRGMRFVRCCVLRQMKTWSVPNRPMLASTRR